MFGIVITVPLNVPRFTTVRVGALTGQLIGQYGSRGTYRWHGGHLEGYLRNWQVPSCIVYHLKCVWRGELTSVTVVGQYMSVYPMTKSPLVDASSLSKQSNHNVFARTIRQGY